MDRRTFLKTAAATGAMAAGLPANAQDAFPSKPVTIVVGFAPGGGTDTLARSLAVPLRVALGQPVVIENRPGASASIASDLVAKSKPDGYTLLVTSVPHVTNPSLMKLPYDTVSAFAPVSLAAKSPFLLVVRAESPIKSLDDVLKRAKTEKLNYASSGNGTADHLSMELLCHLFGLPMTHAPYKGTGPALTDLLGGHVDLGFLNIVGAGQLVRAGKLRALALTTAKRSTLMPEIPSVQELIGKPFDVSAWTGILAPAGTPAPVVERLGRDVGASLRNQKVIDDMKVAGAEVVGSTPGEFHDFIVHEIAKWAGVIKAANIKV